MPTTLPGLTPDEHLLNHIATFTDALRSHLKDIHKAMDIWLMHHTAQGTATLQSVEVRLDDLENHPKHYLDNALETFDRKLDERLTHLENKLAAVSRDVSILAADRATARE